ncbi:MAG: hypothetical protein JSU73_14470 [candidate division WOR-3 bacterium]|nr:MAG: hypothetical protein JSU73_14470 [candidate division WOR-3 bacterium]
MRLLLAIMLFALAGAAGATEEDALWTQPEVTGVPLSEGVVASADAIAIPRMLSYQGRLFDTLGIPVPDTTWSVRFRLYTQVSGGTHYWEETRVVRTEEGLFSVLLGSVTPIPSVPDAGELYLGMRVGSDAEMTPRLRIVSAAYAYKADSADYAAAASPVGPAGGDLDDSYPDPTVGGLQGRAVSSAAPRTGQVLKWTGSQWTPGDDSTGGGGTVSSVRQATGVVCTPNPITATGSVRFDSTWGDSRYINESQGAGGDLGGDYPDPTVAGLRGRTVATTAPATGQVLKWTGSQWAPRDDSTGSGDNAWNRGSPDSVLFTVNRLGIARGGADNMLYGSNRQTHVNLGVACTTGTSGQNYSCATVSGGTRNVASASDATVAGGSDNTASGWYATVAGGSGNTASDRYAAVAGGWVNTASGWYATVGGGYNNAAGDRYAAVGGGIGNTASSWYATVDGGRTNIASDTASAVGGGEYNSATGHAAAVGGGVRNLASGEYAAVGCGRQNTASGYAAAVGGGSSNTASASSTTVAGGNSNAASDLYATVGGGRGNTANDPYAAVGGGSSNRASGYCATVSGGRHNVASDSFASVAGGHADTSASKWSFTAGRNSVVPAGFTNSVAFNGVTASSANQTRVGILVKAAGNFTIDHPLDPHGKILTHYFIEGPEMRNIYDGEAVLDAAGRAEVVLPDYFDALNRNPRVQLTGVGTNDVFVAQEVSAGRFVVGGRPGTKVFWQVTGERKDVSAEATRRMIPVEQPKTGPLADRMLDDEFISGCMEQLEREGKAEGIGFRTAAGRQRYEKMKRVAGEPGR